MLLEVFRQPPTEHKTGCLQPRNNVEAHLPKHYVSRSYSTE